MVIPELLGWPHKGFEPLELWILLLCHAYCLAFISKLKKAAWASALMFVFRAGGQDQLPSPTPSLNTRGYTYRNASQKSCMVVLLTSHSSDLIHRATHRCMEMSFSWVTRVQLKLSGSLAEEEENRSWENGTDPLWVKLSTTDVVY